LSNPTSFGHHHLNIPNPMSAVNRRQFLASIAATVAATPVFAASRRRVPIIDTHVHCFAGIDNTQFPYHPQGSYKPEKASPPEHLLKLMDGAGVDYAIIVHPEPYQDDHRYLEYCMDVGKGRLKGTVLVFADRPGSIEKLPDLAKRLPVVAARIHAYSPQRLPPFDKPELKRLWKLAGDHKLALQLHFEPRYAPGFEPLIKEFKETHVIVDHLGRPFQGTKEEHDRVIRWSDFPNVTMKLSSLPKEGSKDEAQLPGIIKRLADAFGQDRLIYGGGFGDEATPESYRAERERLAKLLSFFSTDSREKVLGGNAARLFDFKAI
jgi:predicted TIM-barrel fold metal-dependent hydrolase